MTMNVFQLTERDQEILQALALKVRLFSQRQVARHWWGGDLANARRRLKRMAQVGLVTRLTVPVRSLPVLESPLIHWQPGQPEPDFGSVAHRCQARWRLRAVHPCTVWIATERGAQFYGAVRRGELKQPTQATHDLGVAAVWMRLNEIAPQWADAWRGEDLFAQTRHGQKLPDAFIVDPQEQTQCVIEFGGGYDMARVAEFHADCAQRNLPYQLW